MVFLLCVLAPVVVVTVVVETIAIGFVITLYLVMDVETFLNIFNRFQHIVIIYNSTPKHITIFQYVDKSEPTYISSG